MPWHVKKGFAAKGWRSYTPVTRTRSMCHAAMLAHPPSASFGLDVGLAGVGWLTRLVNSAYQPCWSPLRFCTQNTRLCTCYSIVQTNTFYPFLPESDLFVSQPVVATNTRNSRISLLQCRSCLRQIQLLSRPLTLYSRASHSLSNHKTSPMVLGYSAY